MLENPKMVVFLIVLLLHLRNRSLHHLDMACLCLRLLSETESCSRKGCPSKGCGSRSTSGGRWSNWGSKPGGSEKSARRRRDRNWVDDRGERLGRRTDLGTNDHGSNIGKQLSEIKKQYSNAGGRARLLVFTMVESFTFSFECDPRFRGAVKDSQ